MMAGARGKLGSFRGMVAANQDMIAVFATEHAAESRRWPVSTGFNIQKLAISGDPGIVFELNGVEIELPSTGVFELGYGMVEIETLVFQSAASVQIVYLY